MRQMLYQNKKITGLVGGCILLYIGAAQADILSRNTPYLRARMGQSGGAIATLIYNAGIPGGAAGLGSLSGVTAAPVTISTNAISGGVTRAGVLYSLRAVTDVNRRGGGMGPITGTFSYNSSVPMGCITAATCSGTTIPLSKISWAIDPVTGNTLNTVTSYDNTAAQIYQIQTDNDPSNGGTGTRHRTFYQFKYENDTLLPAGTYEGTVTITGEGIF